MPRPEKVQAGPDDYDVLMNRAARESARVQIAFNEQTPNQEKVQKAGGPRAGSRGLAHGGMRIPAQRNQRPQELFRAIQDVLRGKTYVTPQIARGMRQAFIRDP